MKKFLKTITFSALLVLTVTAGAWGYPVNVGDTIYFNDGVGTVGGGEFGVATSRAGQPLFKTFCLEKNEYLEYTSPFKVVGISDAAKNGGVGGATNGADPLSAATKWLYWNYVTGDLHNLVSDYTYNSDSGANALQTAIWYLEDEITRTDSLLADKLITTALNADMTNFNGDVKVLNLRYAASGDVAQDQLVAGAPVPEPSTLLLLGGGLFGLAFYGRKRMKS